MSYNKYIPFKEQFFYYIGRSITNFVAKNIDLNSTKAKNKILKQIIQKGFLIKKKANKLYIKFAVASRDYTIAVRNSNSSDLLVFDQIILNNDYEAAINVINENKISIKNILDLGSNIGLSLVYFNSKFPEAKIIAIEPDKNNYKMLLENIKTNNLNAITMNFGVWHKNQNLVISKDFRDGKDWSLSTKVANKNDSSVIKGITIDEILSQTKTENIDLLKIDIEGAEKYIFREDPKIDEVLFKTNVIIIEIHEESESENYIIEKLINHEFKLSKSGEYTVGIKIKRT
ncbi:MAG: FkbM family methyltransferase [Bacteroidota bacterium]|nr:FkbM family methyltransferase [Bacteroidota bacterium]MDP3144354.1 FkbM family methyltransferase [Bacteroidota bacterium]